MTNFDFLKKDMQFVSFADMALTAKNPVYGYYSQD